MEDEPSLDTGWDGPDWDWFDFLPEDEKQEYFEFVRKRNERMAKDPNRPLDRLIERAEWGL